MKKYAMLIAAAIAVMCTGCQSDTVSGGGTSVPAAESISVSTAADTSGSPAVSSAESPAESTAGTTGATSAEESAPDGHIDIEKRSALWRGSDSYFVFYPDGSGGCTMSFENGTGVAFRYDENADGSTTFHMGAEDNSINAFTTSNPDGTLSIVWEDGREEVFYPVNWNVEEFTFYTNEELQNIALAYYRANNDDYTPQFSGIQTNPDSTATIQLYDQTDGHNSTAAWYTVDRVTLKGTDDIFGENIDMSGFASAADGAMSASGTAE